MSAIKNAFAKVKPFAKGAGIVLGGTVVVAGGWLAIQALKGTGAESAAAAVGDAVADAATAVADTAATAVAAAFRG